MKLIADLLNEVKPTRFMQQAISGRSARHPSRLPSMPFLWHLKETRAGGLVERLLFVVVSGAWHEWPIDEIEMAVPISPDELN